MANNIYLPPSPVVPQSLLISNITQAQFMVVTVTTSNMYVVGQNVYLSVPASYQMIEANGLTGQIIGINGLNFTLNIDSTQFTPFVVPMTYQEQPASLSPAGSRNLYNVTTVPFRSLDGTVGN